MKEITDFIFRYTPFDNKFPIRYVDIHIIAETGKEAELVNINNNWKFFDQDCTVEVIEGKKEYKSE